MGRLVFAVGESPAGELLGLYTGSDADAALAAINAAGKAGAIKIAYLYRNPQPDRRISFARTAVELSASEMLSAQQAEARREAEAIRIKATAVATAALGVIAEAIAGEGSATSERSGSAEALSTPSSDVGPDLGQAGAAVPSPDRGAITEAASPADVSDEDSTEERFGSRSKKKR